MDSKKGVLARLTYLFLKSIQIKLFRIIHTRGNIWLFDNYTGQNIFVCQCSDLNTLHLREIPIFYGMFLSSFCKFRSKFKPNYVQEILEVPLVCNIGIQFCGKPLLF